MEIVNICLTIILIGIYLFNTKSQNEKIKAQSGIINDLMEHVKFFDVQKIKSYVELRESEKDKLLELNYEIFKKEIELQYKDNSLKDNDQTEFMDELSIRFYDQVKELYSFIAIDLLLKPDDEINKILDKSFPKNKRIILIMLKSVRKEICKKYKIKDISEIQITGN